MEQRNARARERLLETAKQYQGSTYIRKFVAPLYQKMIRAEFAADSSPVAHAVIDGELKEVKRELGQCVCISCGKVHPWDSGIKGMHTGHFLASRRNSILFDDDNVAPQCSHCNVYRSGNPQAFRLWMLTVRGEAVIARLERRKTESVSFTRDELVDMRIAYTARLDAAKQKMEQQDAMSKAAILTADDVEIWIDDEFKAACPPLTADELKQLRENIHRDKRFVESLKCWKDGDAVYLIDGHHRLEIWNTEPEDTPIPPPHVEFLEFATKQEAVNWIIFHQLGRRNLPEKQVSYLRGKLLQERVAETADREEKSSKTQEKTAQGGFRQRVENPPDDKGGRPIEPRREAARAVAERTNTTEQTVLRDAEFTAALDTIGKVNEKARDDILSGALKVAKKDVIAIGNLSTTALIGDAIRNLRKGHAWESGNGQAAKPADDPFAIQRSKTVKTVEALQRAFDDLNGLRRRNHEHAEAIASCKVLLKTAKEWQ